MKMSQNGENPITCVALFLFNTEGKLFVMERLYNTGLLDDTKTIHCIPGGKIDWLETAHKAVVRETREEIGIDISCENVEFTGQYTNDRWPHINTHCVTLYFKCNLTREIEPILKESDKHKNGKWISVDEVPELFCACHKLLPMI
jgi:ADP-ribose pyrophosphatase YjhB (NUDIX family)